MVHCVARYHYSWITPIDTELVPRSLSAKSDVFLTGVTVVIDIVRMEVVR
jgi:hypothetical protein